MSFVLKSDGNIKSVCFAFSLSIKQIRKRRDLQGKSGNFLYLSQILAKHKTESTKY